MTTFMPFVYDMAGFLTNQKCFIITGRHIAFLTAFFNSSVFKYCFSDNFPKLGDMGREMSKIFFDKIPVKIITDHEEHIFRNLVDDIQKEYDKSKAIAIDALIFDLYGLSEEERQIIGFVEFE